MLVFSRHPIADRFRRIIDNAHHCVTELKSAKKFFRRIASDILAINKQPALVNASRIDSEKLLKRVDVCPCGIYSLSPAMSNNSILPIGRWFARTHSAMKAGDDAFAIGFAFRFIFDHTRRNTRYIRLLSFVRHRSTSFIGLHVTM